MKRMTIMGLILSASSTAFAGSITCYDYWNNKAELTFGARSARISSFRHSVPDSGRLGYNGERGGSYFFTNGNTKRLQVQKSVVESGRGYIWYHYRPNGRDKGSESSKLRCI